MKRLSVIIPMYNVEEYVEKCIRSLEDQDIPTNEYEIICINDGSPDNCRGIVLGLQEEFDNIILIDKKNQGVSLARNDGIDKASGNYILFIDPDDYVEVNSLKRVLQTAVENKAQVSFLGFTILSEKGTIKEQVVYENWYSQVFNGTEAYFISRGDGSTDPDRMWAVLFLRSFINKNNLRYLPDVPFLEDGEFIARILCLAKRCIFDREPFYLRTTRSGSATNSALFYHEKATIGFLLAADNLKRFKREHYLNDNQRKFINQPIVKFAVLALSSSLRKNMARKRKAIYSFFKKNDLNKLCLDGCHQPYLLYGKLFNFSPYILLYYLVFKSFVTLVRRRINYLIK